MFISLLRLAVILSIATSTVSAFAQDSAQTSGWSTYRNTGFGFLVSYPADVFTPQTLAENVNGTIFQTGDGSARFSVSAYINTDDAEDIAYYKSKVLETEDYPNLTYQPGGDTWFVLSGYHQDAIYYEKYILSCNWRVINALLITYPRAERTTYDKIVTGLEKTFKPGHGENNPVGSCEERPAE